MMNKCGCGMKRGDDGQHVGERGGDNAGLNRHPAVIVGGLQQIAEQPDHVIGDGRDREAFHRGLQPQLQPGPRVHRFQQFLVLLLQFDVDAGAQEIGGARQL